MKKFFSLVLCGLVVGLSVAGCQTDAQVACFTIFLKTLICSRSVGGLYSLMVLQTLTCLLSRGCILLMISAINLKSLVRRVRFYKKHFLGLSDNVTYFVEQLEAKDVSTYHYKVIFKPQTIIPDIDVKIK